MAVRLILAALAAAVAVHADVTPNDNALTGRTCRKGFDSFPFCDPTKSVEERAADIASRIHPEDKGPILTARGSPRGNLASAEYIGLNKFDWGENALHGDQTLCVKGADGVGRCSTSFPMPNALGNSFNRTAVQTMGLVIGLEVRAQWRAGDTEASTWSGRPPIGPQTWSPTINQPRDPRWGRYQEVPSSSPLWLGEYGALYVKGAQYGLGSAALLRAAGLRPRTEEQAASSTLLSVTCIKHILAYSLEGHHGSPTSRHDFDALVSPFDMADTYLKPFHDSLGRDLPAMGVMCSYNAVNGAPTCAGGGGGVVKEYLRNRWGSQAYMTSDSGAIQDIYDAHHMEPTPEAAVCAALVNGSADMNSGDVFWHHLENAVSQGLCSWDDVDAAVVRTMSQRIRLGLMDEPSAENFWNVSVDVIGSAAHVAEAKQASRDSLALLKNDGPTLPFKRGATVAVIGPHSQSQSAQLGSYLGQICSNDHNDTGDFSCVTTPQDAIAAANTGGKVVQATGCSVTGTDKSGFGAAVDAAKGADYVVLVVGSDQSVEGESHDRTDIDLPGVQHELIAAVAAAGRPTAVIVMRGGPLDITPERDNADVGAIVDAGFPGQYGAEAFAGAIFGDFSPGGRLSTPLYPASYTSRINMTDMRMAFGPAPRGDRYLLPNDTVYAFGAGLSYSTFKLEWASGGDFGPGKSPSLPTSGSSSAACSVVVTNTGPVAADATLLARFRIASLPSGSPVAALRPVLQGQLFDFARVTLQPGQSQAVTFPVAASTLELVSPDSGDTVIAPGKFEVEVSEFTSSLTAGLELAGSVVTVDKYPAEAAEAFRLASEGSR